MKLLNIHYHAKGKTPKYLLLLYLGQRNEKICGIETYHINDKEMAEIVRNSDVLSKLSLDRKIFWIKNNCPFGYKGYKEINSLNITILGEYNI